MVRIGLPGFGFFRLVDDGPGMEVSPGVEVTVSQVDMKGVESLVALLSSNSKRSEVSFVAVQ